MPDSEPTLIPAQELSYAIGMDDLERETRHFDELVAQIIPENRYPEVSVGAEIGREIVEYEIAEKKERTASTLDTTMASARKVMRKRWHTLRRLADLDAGMEGRENL